jgi:hypothetical protein
MIEIVVSIHIPCAGSDSGRFQYLEGGAISIHTPRTGSDFRRNEK